ncbi:MAG: hypothetical protein HY735_06405 [Verrucomicrobia bacterium]|nr:hypothetical protein [Verrucomicrobiota bacterium]
MATDLENSALARLLRPLSQTLTSQLAMALLQLQADEELQSRYDELAEKGNEGRLTSQEQAELDSLVEANTLLGILKAEAELFLKQPKAQ